MQSTEPFDQLNAAKTLEQKAAENTALETIAKPLVEAGLPEEVKAAATPFAAEGEPLFDDAFRVGGTPHPSQRTELFDDITHMIRTLREMSIGTTDDMNYLAAKLVKEARRQARG